MDKILIKEITEYMNMSSDFIQKRDSEAKKSKSKEHDILTLKIVMEFNKKIMELSRKLDQQLEGKV